MRARIYRARKGNSFIGRLQWRRGGGGGGEKKSFCCVVARLDLVFGHPCPYIVCACTRSKTSLRGADCLSGM